MANILFVNLRKSEFKTWVAEQQAKIFGHEIFHVLDQVLGQPIEKSFTKLYAYPSKESFIDTVNLAVDMFGIQYITTQTDFLNPLLDEIKTSAKIIPDIKSSINSIVDKIEFSYFCEKNNLPYINYSIPKNIDELKNVKGPFFIKTSNGTGGSVSLENKLRYYDYNRYESSEKFIEILKETNSLEDFFNIQINGEEFEIKKYKYNKGISGLKTKFIIQDCVFSDLYYILGGVVIDYKIYFVYVSKIVNPEATDIYFHDHKYRQNVFLDYNQDISKIIDLCGENVYNSFIDQFNNLIKLSGLKNSIFHIDFIPYKNTLVMQDLNLRTGGTFTNILKNNNLKHPLNLDYPSLWKFTN